MGKKSKRRSTRPASKSQSGADTSVLSAIRAASNEYPLLSTRFLQSGWGFGQMTDRMRREFLDKWHKRSLISWTEFVNHHRHGLGSEFIPKKEIKAQIPRQFQELTKFRVSRHQENLPFVGWKDGGIFYVLWIETKYGDLYSH